MTREARELLMDSAAKIDRSLQRAEEFLDEAQAGFAASTRGVLRLIDEALEILKKEAHDIRNLRAAIVIYQDDTEKDERKGNT